MPPDAADLSTPTLMRAARGAYARSIRAHLQGIGISDLPRNGAVILFGIHDSGTPRGDLPASLGVSKQAVSQVVDVLVNRGYLLRGPDQSDRRRVLLELTERGQDVVEAVWRGTEAIDQQLAARVSAEEIEAMRTGLKALADIKAETAAAGTAQRRGARRFRQFSPIFPVRDMAAALAHYATLGFQTFNHDGDDDYGFANRDGLSIHLALEAGHGPASAYLTVRDADTLFEEWSQPGVAGLTRPVALMPYGLREGSHIDPDGNVIRFGSEAGG
jgi:DNA-binding MarR family transcriptional regulator